MSPDESPPHLHEGVYWLHVYAKPFKVPVIFRGRGGFDKLQ